MPGCLFSLRAATTSVLALGVVGGLACSSRVGGGPNEGPTSSQAKELARSFQDEIESEASTFTLAAPGVPPSAVMPAGCPTASNTGDSDGDGVLDDALLTFADPPCRVSGFDGGTLSLTGTIRVQDPNLSNNTAYNLTLTNLSWDFADTAGVRDYRARRNGTRARLGSSDAATVHTVLTTERRRPQVTAVATIGLDLDWAFDAATPGSLKIKQALPHGALSVTGTLHWQRSTEDWSLTVTTVQPLVYDPGCGATPYRITSGRVDLAGTVAGQPGTLVLEWTACGANPSWTWVP